MKKTKFQTIYGYFVLIFFLLGIILPFLWMVVTAFKPDSEVGAYPPTLLPKQVTLSHFQAVFGTYHFQSYLLNSAIVAVISTFLTVALASMSGFALAQLPLKGKAPTMIGLLFISMFPPIAVISPLYMIMRELNWLNTYQALIIPYTAFHLPFAIWILRNYFLEIPKELFEASKVDGAGVYKTFYSIFLPLTGPGLFTAAIFTFVATWTEFFMALVFNANNAMKTIPVGIALFGGQFTIPYGDIFAASLISIIPILILTLIFRKWIVSGLTQGAVKG
jgi:multiple sugar transport system permease protein